MLLLVQLSASHPGTGQSGNRTKNCFFGFDDERNISLILVYSYFAPRPQKAVLYFYSCKRKK